MKKILAMLLASSMILAFAACGNDTNETTTEDPSATTEATTDTSAEATTDTTETTTEAPVVVDPADVTSLDFFREIWNAYIADETIDEADKLLTVGGGDWDWYGKVSAEFEANNPMPSDDASDAEWEAYYTAFAEATQGPGEVAPVYTEENTYLASISFPTEHVGLIDSAASAYHGMMLNFFTGAVYHVSDSANVETLANALKSSYASTQWVCGQPEVYTVITVGDYVIGIYGLETIVDDLTSVINGLHDDASVLCKEALM